MFALALASMLPAQERMAYVGTYTGPASQGIYAFRFEPGSGKMTAMGLMAETVSPSFLAIHPNRRFLYAVNEVADYDGKQAGSVSSFSIDAGTGKLKFLNRVSSRGAGPCHLALDKTGRWLFVANYAGGSVAVFPVHTDGTLGEASAFIQHSGSSVNRERQSGPHAHSANPSPDNRFVLVADLGLDQVFSYRFDSAKGTLAPDDPPYTKIAAGSGPRHMAFAPDGKYAYVLSELLATVTAFRYDASGGSMEELQTLSTLPDNFTGNKSGAEIAMHPNGKFLYASNRGDDSIAIFRVDPVHGTISAAGRVPTQGKTPRNFAIDLSGAYLFAANQNSGSVVEFRIDPSIGGLTPTGEVLNIPSPVCIVFVAVR